MIFSDIPAHYAPTLGSPDTDFFREHLALPEDYMLKELYRVKAKIGRNDALKLYEMAFHSKEILELGCFQGASTYVMANACRDSQFGKITSVDLSLEALPIAKDIIKNKGLNEYVKFHHSDAVVKVKELIEEKAFFDFVFVDHDHAYESVYNVCVNLDNVVTNGGYVLFHDYQDTRNQDPNSQMQVYKATKAGLPLNFEFIGLFGQGGLFRKA